MNVEDVPAVVPNDSLTSGWVIVLSDTSTVPSVLVVPSSVDVTVSKGNNLIPPLVSDAVLVTGMSTVVVKSLVSKCRSPLFAVLGRSEPTP